MFSNRTFASIHQNNLDPSSILKELLNPNTKPFFTQEIELTFNNHDDEVNEFTETAATDGSEESDDDSSRSSDGKNALVIVPDNDPLVIILGNDDVNQTQPPLPHPHALNGSYLVHDQDMKVSCDTRHGQVIMQSNFKNISFFKTNDVLLDLCHILKASNAPLILFDRIVHWVKTHE